MRHAGQVKLLEYSADDRAQLSSAYRLRQRVSAYDTPWERPVSEHRFAMQIRYGWTGEPPRCFQAVVGGELVGLAELFTSEWDNPDMVWMSFWIDPACRRQGHGTALLDALIAESVRSGRDLITLECWDIPAARAFAGARGWPVKQVEAVRRLHPRAFSAAHWDTLATEAAEHAAAYETVRILGASPASVLPELGRLTEAINDAPNDDLEWADEVFPAERVVQYEQANLAADQRLYRVLARHRESGALAAHTVVVVYADDPTIAVQHDTAVAPDHRGHRLGLLVKAAMMQWLAQAEPAIETIDTGNAASNAHMVAINERLGYELLGNLLYLQRRCSPGSPG